MNFENRYKIETDFWKRNFQDKVDTSEAKRLKSYKSEGLTSEQFSHDNDYIYDFKRSWDIDNYINGALSAKNKPSWNIVATCYPYKDPEKYYENAQYFWDWVIEDPENRLAILGKWRKTSLHDTFWKPCDYPNPQLDEPELCVDLFKKIYGDTFKSMATYPLKFGAEQWQPQREVDIKEQFKWFSGGISGYLYGSDRRFFKLSYIGLLDYWFSMIDILLEQEWFTDNALFIRKHPVCTEDNYEDFDKLSWDEQDLVDEQMIYIDLIAHLMGYHVSYQEQEEFIRNDPEAEAYIKERFFSYPWPDTMLRLFDFIETHKEESLYVVTD